MDLVWIDGLRQTVDEATWGDAAARFLGLGYRTRLPVVDDMAGPVNFHRGLAQKVASTLSGPFDPTPWAFIEAGNFTVGSALEVVAGWPSAGPFPGDMSSHSWTAVASVAPAAHDATHGEGVSLPWTYNSDSPLAGLPTLSALDEHQAARHLRAVRATVGLWWNGSAHLVSSTTGVPLVHVGGRAWVYPDRSAGIVSSWAFFQIATAVSALPAAITADMLETSKVIAFVSETGGITVLDSLDGRALVAIRELVLSLLSTRLGFLA